MFTLLSVGCRERLRVALAAQGCRELGSRHSCEPVCGCLCLDGRRL